MDGKIKKLLMILVVILVVIFVVVPLIQAIFFSTNINKPSITSRSHVIQVDKSDK